MRVEATVFGGDERVAHVRRHRGERHVHAPHVFEMAEEVAVAVETLPPSLGDGTCECPRGWGSRRSRRSPARSSKCDQSGAGQKQQAEPGPMEPRDTRGISGAGACVNRESRSHKSAGGQECDRGHATIDGTWHIYACFRPERQRPNDIYPTKIKLCCCRLKFRDQPAAFAVLAASGAFTTLTAAFRGSERLEHCQRKIGGEWRPGGLGKTAGKSRRAHRPVLEYHVIEGTKRPCTRAHRRASRPI